MAYSNFTKKDLGNKFGVKFSEKNLFPNVNLIEPSAWLSETLLRSEKLGYNSEKSRSERLVSPILEEIALLNEGNVSVSLYSGLNLDVDADLGLNGECDFLFSFSKIRDFVSPPIFCVAEAKKQDLDLGIIQASAQLIGAKKFNDENNFYSEVLFGATTTGDVWRFLRFENNEITFDEKRYFINNLPKLLGILQNIVEVSAKYVFSN